MDSIGFKKQKHLTQIINKLKQYDVEKIFLFGSMARGEDDELSDIDIIIIKDTTDDFFEGIRKVLRLLNLMRAIDVLVYTPSEMRAMKECGNVFIETVEKEGILLYER